MSKVLQKTGKELRVLTVEAQELVWRLAPRDWIGKRKAAISKVARDLGWTFPRTWNIAHGRARIIRAEEWIQLNQEAAALAQSAKERQGALHANDLLARAAAARIGEMAGPPRVEGVDAVEHRSQPGGARPDLLKRRAD